MKFTGTTQGMLQKKIISGKQLNKKILKALFRELEQYYGNKFLLTGEIYINQSLRKQIRGLLLKLCQIGMDDYVEVDILTQIPKFSA